MVHAQHVVAIVGDVIQVLLVNALVVLLNISRAVLLVLLAQVDAKLVQVHLTV